MGKTPTAVFGAALAGVTLAVIVAAQPTLPGARKVPGETWSNSMSMEMQGMTLPMPGGGRETCVPVGRAQESMAAPDKECQVYDSHAAGNRFSAKFRCNGQQRMEGSMESIADGNHIRGTMHAHSPDGNDFTMKFDNTRIGKACEAVDYSGVKPPPPPPNPQFAMDESCKNSLENGKVAATDFVGANAPCAKSPYFKNFCAYVKTPDGFLGLDMDQRKNANLDYSSIDSLMDTSVMKTPLTASLKACGYDHSPAGVAAIKSSLFKTAVADDDWAYILIYTDTGSGGAGGSGGSAGGGGAGGGGGGGGGGSSGGGGAGGAGGALGGLGGSAQQHCTGLSTSHVSADSAKYSRQCRAFGYPLSRGDYEGARALAYQSFDIEYTSRGGGVAAGGAGASATGASAAKAAAAETAAAGGPTPADAQQAAKDKSKEAIVEKGKKVLRGIFGR